MYVDPYCRLHYNSCLTTSVIYFEILEDDSKCNKIDDYDMLGT